MSETRQRWRLVFRRDEPAMYLSHLDAIHSWERALRRGSIPMAMSEGFNPRPKLVFAAPLQLGMLAEHDLADLFLAERLAAPDLRDRLAACLPLGYVATDLFDVWAGEPALAPQLAAADYRLTLLGAMPEQVGGAVERLLAAGTLPRERQREARTIKYDLRPLVMGLRAASLEGSSAAGAGVASGAASAAVLRPAVGNAAAAGAIPPGEPATLLWMRLRHSQDGGTGRVEEVVAALAQEIGLSLAWTGGEEQARPAAMPTEPGSGAGGVEIVRPVRERLWLAGELG
jgi:radical SAM-linked protein